MSLPTNFLASLTCPHSKDVFERLLNDSREKGKAVTWAWRNELSPADLYSYLMARFGKPNGPQNFFRNDDSDNLIHWDWMLDHPAGQLYVLGMNFRTEILITGDLDVTDTDSAELATLIKSDFSAYGQKMAEVRKSLEKWVEFVNPYKRLRIAVEKLLLDVRALDLQPETQKIPDIAAVDEFRENRWEEVLSRYSKGLGLCFGIRSMLPVMAEAYVNFLLFVLMRPELKADERLKENTIRQPIDVRVKTLHMTCFGFAKPIDYASPECKAYHTLVNERNDLLHGNVVLDKLTFNEVYFQGKVPVFKEYRSMWERSVGVEIKAVGLHRLEGEVATVNAFIEYLTTCMTPAVKKQIDLMCEKRDLGWNSQNGRIGVLFPDHLVDMFAGPKTSSGGAEGDA
ncbi:MAG: hypothetical protein WC762_12120 [Methylobacter sp.]|jgi:hypothetical protein